MEPDMNPVIPEPAGSGANINTTMCAIRRKEPVMDNHPNQAAPVPPADLPAGVFYTRRKELVFALFLLMFSLFTANSIIEGGLNLGFSLGMLGILVTVLVYQGKILRRSPYGICLTAGSLGLVTLFGYSVDAGLLLLGMPAFFFLWNLALGHMTGVHRRNPGGIGCVLDGGETLFGRSFRNMTGNLRSLGYAKGEEGPVKRRIGGVLVGLAISIPLLAVLLPLLMASDAAFEGLMDRTIFSDMGTLFGTVLLALVLALPSYSQSITLARTPEQKQEDRAYEGKVPSMTLNTVLFIAGFFYILYLLSQLAYFFSAFSGILPKGFTTAQYARRGFFEMCGICALNLGLVALTAGLVKRKEGKVPTVTKALCLFVCLFCLVLVAASASKMALYVTSFGLTRKRIMTFVLMLVLGISVVGVGIWLLKPRFPYMKMVLLAAMGSMLLLGWGDVDAQVARYNVTAYQKGTLREIDMTTISRLSAGSTPYVALLLEDSDPEVAETAENILQRRLRDYEITEDGTGLMPRDFRAWNWKTGEERRILEELLPMLTD